MAAIGSVHMPLVVIVVVAVVVAVFMVRMASVRCVLAVSTVFWFEGFVHRNHCHMHVAQHVSQYMVGFNFQMICLKFNGYMAVTQMVGGAGQIKHTAMVRAMGNT